MSSLTLTDLPFELRTEIYKYLLPTSTDILLTPGWKAIISGDGLYDLDLVDGQVFTLRHDGQPCYPAILGTNRLIYAEAVRMMYNRTFTITVAEDGIKFLDSDFIPTTFPFHLAKAIRIRILAPVPTEHNPLVWTYCLQGPIVELSWRAFETQLYQAIKTVFSLTSHDRPVQRLIVDATEASSEKWETGPERQARDREALWVLFSVFWELGMDVRRCEVRVPEWVRGCDMSLSVARRCGRAALGWKEGKGGENGERDAAQRQAGAEPVVVVKEQVLGGRIGEGPTYTEWGERWVPI
ncbi:MAG: hypothetical protein Q9195_007882 [Heterodermia aff. obscurata]